MLTLAVAKENCVAEEECKENAVILFADGVVDPGAKVVEARDVTL